MHLAIDLDDAVYASKAIDKQLIAKEFCRRQESNPRPTVYKFEEVNAGDFADRELAWHPLPLSRQSTTKRHQFPQISREHLFSESGALGRDRTRDLRITNALLYQLSYKGILGEERTIL